MIRLIAILIIAIALCASCTTKMPSGMLAAAQRDNSWGPPPENPRAIVDQATARWLVDPSSLSQLRVFEPRREQFYINRSLFEAPTAWIGWAIPFEANAKNRMGGYTGLKTWAVYWRDGKIYEMREWPPDPHKYHHSIGGIRKGNYHRWRDGKWVPPS